MHNKSYVLESQNVLQFIMEAVLLDAYYPIVEESPTTNRPIHGIQNLIATLLIGPLVTYEIIVCCQKTACSMMVNNHYTTTPRLAMDDLTLKTDTATDDLALKSYSDLCRRRKSCR